MPNAKEAAAASELRFQGLELKVEHLNGRMNEVTADISALKDSMAQILEAVTGVVADRPPPPLISPRCPLMYHLLWEFTESESESVTLQREKNECSLEEIELLAEDIGEVHKVSFTNTQFSNESQSFESSEDLVNPSCFDGERRSLVAVGMIASQEMVAARVSDLIRLGNGHSSQAPQLFDEMPKRDVVDSDIIFTPTVHCFGFLWDGDGLNRLKPWPDFMDPWVLFVWKDGLVLVCGNTLSLMHTEQAPLRDKVVAKLNVAEESDVIVDTTLAVGDAQCGITGMQYNDHCGRLTEFDWEVRYGRQVVWNPGDNVVSAQEINLGVDSEFDPGPKGLEVMELVRRNSIWQAIQYGANFYSCCIRFLDWSRPAIYPHWQGVMVGGLLLGVEKTSDAFATKEATKGGAVLTITIAHISKIVGMLLEEHGSALQMKECAHSGSIGRLYGTFGIDVFAWQSVSVRNGYHKDMLLESIVAAFVGVGYSCFDWQPCLLASQWQLGSYWPFSRVELGLFSLQC